MRTGDVARIEIWGIDVELLLSEKVAVETAHSTLIGAGHYEAMTEKVGIINRWSAET